MVGNTQEHQKSSELIQVVFPFHSIIPVLEKDGRQTASQPASPPSVEQPA
jgi:hypothetical protein